MTQRYLKSYYSDFQRISVLCTLFLSLKLKIQSIFSLLAEAKCHAVWKMIEQRSLNKRKVCSTSSLFQRILKKMWFQVQFDKAG